MILPAPSRPPKSDDEYAELLRDSLLGRETALRCLVEELAPTVHVRVARALRRRANDARGRDLRQDIDDLTQDVFVSLFAKQGKALRAWRPERGLSFRSFVGFIAEREVGMRLRILKRSPWTEDPTAGTALNRALGSTTSLERSIEARDVLEHIFDELRIWLTPEGRRYFELLYVEDRPVREAAERAGTTPEALYAWRSRLLKRLRKLRLRLEGDRDA